MNSIDSAALLWPLGITFLAPFVLWLARKNINLREGVSFAAAGLTFLSLLPLGWEF